MENTNILMLLIPKAQVDYLYSDFTIRQALEKMNAHGFNTIPVINKETGVYERSITYGDFLSYILKNRTDFDEFEKLSLKDVESNRNIKAVSSTKDISDLVSTILEQNYVPVVDDKNVFIGIVTRKKVMSSYLNIDK